MKTPRLAEQSWPPIADLFGVFSPAGVDGAVEVFRSEAPAHQVLTLTETVAVAVSNKTAHARVEDGSAIFVKGTIVGPPWGTDLQELLSLVQQRGLDVLGDLLGLAAIAFWDAQSQTLSLIRHPGGAPRLAYRIDGGSVWWSTRVDQLARPGDEVDPAAVTNSLRFGSLIPGQTMYAAIRSLIPGHALQVSERGVEHKRIWRPAWEPRNETRPTAETVEELDALLSDSISSWHSTTAMEPALLMSGGIDSVGLAAAMHRLGMEFTTYTLTFSGEVGIIDEFSEAALVANHLGVEHVPIVYGPEFIEQHIDWMVAHYESPFGYAAHTANLAPVAQAGHELVFGGTGPDTWYLTGSDERWKFIQGFIPRPVAGAATKAMRPLNNIRGIKGLSDSLDRYARGPLEAVLDGLGPAVPHSEIHQFITEPGLVDAAWLTAKESVAAFFGDQPLNDLSAVESFGWNYFTYPERGTHWMTRWPEAYGMRSALPYTNPEFPRILARLANKGPDRCELRELARKSLPENLAFNRKIGQSLPLASWFRGPLRELVHDRLANLENQTALIDHGVVRRHLDEHMSGERNHQWLLMKLVTIEAWNRRFSELTATRNQGPS